LETGGDKMEYNINQLNLDRCYLYIEKCLNCGYTIAQKILDCNLLLNSQVHTYLPKGFNHFYDFQWGFIGDWSKAYDYYQGYLLKYLDTVDNPLVIMGDNELSKDDPWLQNVLSKRLTIGNEVYFLLTEEDKNREVIDRTYADSITWRNITILTSLPDSFSIVKHYSQDSNIVDELVNRVRAVIIDAYDQDSFLFIERS
jgi:hypothetical protein